MEKGLTTDQAKAAAEKFGRNEIIAKKIVSPLVIFFSQFPTVLNGIMAIAGVFSLIIRDFVDGIFIFAVLFLNAVVGFIQEYKAERSLEKLMNFIKPASRVMRDGKEVRLATAELVPGDIVILSEGDRIPADGTLAAHEDIEIDEAILTGESLPVAKKTHDEVYNGTLVIKGKAHLLVEKIGMQTKFGQIAETLADVQADKTPLRTRLDQLGKVLSAIAILTAFLLIPIGITQERALFPLVLLAISISVAAVPQSLPTVVTIALAIGTHRMAKKNAIVRKMPAVETLGSVQIILVDKTGTLTQNVMRVKKYWTRKKEDFPDLIRACILGNTASLIQKTNNKGYDVVGDRTDGALLLFAKNEMEKIKTEKGKIVDEFVFDPDTKTVTTVVKDGAHTNVFVRGAPEAILTQSKLPISEKEHITKLFEEHAKEGLRIIGFAKKTEEHKNISRSHLEQHLTFLGFVGIYDPPRNEATEAVHKAKTAGIRTIMVTGDNEFTALSIARDVGLIEKDEDVITGDELKKLSDDELESIIDHARIFARSKPEDKLRLVNILKKKGAIVGVTGDGVNDALALKRADVGIAMGKSGTDVAKEASDIVLTDDNFATLVHAVEEGRTIYNNILKATTYLVSGNLAELSLVFFATLFGLPSPLLPTQILWINLVTDGLPALALASDTKDPTLLSNLPRDPKQPILTGNRLLFIAVVGFGLATTLLIIFTLLLATHSETVSRTITFNLLVFLHLLLAFAVRGRTGVFTNRFLVYALLGTLALQLIISTVPFLQNVFHLGF
ncbi:MAG: cation-translocating P-type ATPase [Candidatus Levybacteria bacterium]|nr:cation-translocating P-type ATPase [Candidatus Levybacteria bacterium]